MVLPIIRKLAFHVTRPESERFQHFVTTVLAARPVYQEPGLAACQLPGGSLLECYSPGSSFPGYLFAHGPVMASFRVPDLAQALAQAQAAGLRLVHGPEQVCPGLSYGHVQLAAGIVIGLYQEGPVSLLAIGSEY
jgi:catechol 2,3-dioxygenase-like lactoylglutathione lyase family enzyme